MFCQYLHQRHIQHFYMDLKYIVKKKKKGESILYLYVCVFLNVTKNSCTVFVFVVLFKCNLNSVLSVGVPGRGYLLE